MFLSLLKLDERPDARGGLLLRDVYALHQRLWRAFPDQPPGDRPFLFRIEPDRPMRILVQSAIEPDWELAFHNAPGYLDAEAPFQKRQISLQFESGQQLRFRIQANPTKKIPKFNPKTGAVESSNWRRRMIPDLDGQWAWLERQLQDAAQINPSMPDFYGADLSKPLPLPRQFLSGWKGSNRKDPDIQIVSHLFEGALTVRDPKALLDAIQTGIGPAKAFGCGLLSLAPA